MRRLRQLPVPQDGDNVLFPDGQIRNETITQQGTPVVRELYGDIITNIYKIVRDAGIVFNDSEDSETNGYQFLDALKVFVNNLNDRRQVLSVSTGASGGVISAGLNFDNLPDDYVFIGQVSDELQASETYTIKSAGSATYNVLPLTSDVPASGHVLVILGSAGTTIVGIGAAIDENTILNTAFGTPLAFSEEDKVYYLREGFVFDDTPASFAVQSAIQTFTSNVNIKVLEGVIFKGRFLFLCLDENLIEYRIFSFLSSNLTAVNAEITFTKTSGTDERPYMYCDGQFLYFTNSSGSINNSASDNVLSKQDFDEATSTLSQVSVITLDGTFQKTTNVFMNVASQLLYTFVQSVLYSYPLSGTSRNQVGFFPGIDGVVFRLNDSTYYSNSNTATKWNY